MPLNILLFGASGLAGGGVLRACLESPDVASVRALTRRPLVEQPKLRAVRHDDYLDYRPVATEFEGVDACLYCLGISTSQVSSEAQYRRITQEFALAAAAMLAQRSPGAVFHYLSGEGASLDSRFMWARVKAETERHLQDTERFPTLGTVSWRPAAIGGPASPSGPWVYHLVRWLFPLMRPFRSLYVESDALGRAMIQAVRDGTRNRVFDNREIRDLSDRADEAERADRAKGGH